ncbi:hypothetical protein H9P43_005014 [Blastocladiella emersonii ATCC 22665]|nr:hypothetical protein H9P43_005014 [Blastocladiella emersonii ATCC 22665]
MKQNSVQRTNDTDIVPIAGGGDPGSQFSFGDIPAEVLSVVLQLSNPRDCLSTATRELQRIAADDEVARVWDRRRLTPWLRGGTKYIVTCRMTRHLTDLDWYLKRVKSGTSDHPNLNFFKAASRAFLDLMTPKLLHAYTSAETSYAQGSSATWLAAYGYERDLNWSARGYDEEPVPSCLESPIFSQLQLLFFAIASGSATAACSLLRDTLMRAPELLQTKRNNWFLVPCAPLTSWYADFLHFGQTMRLVDYL